jgi:pimeloyl-ACP methyl ester carboxylesterase
VLFAEADAGGGCALAGAGVDLNGYEAARSIAVQLASARRFRRKLHRVTQPTLLIHGAEDRVVHPASARWAAQERPDWRFVMIEDMGHTPQLEDPDLFVSIVNGWLRQTVHA